MTALKLTAIGSSIGVIIPDDVLARLNVTEGDVLHAVESPDGGYHLTPHDPYSTDALPMAEEIMRRYRNTLLILAP